MEKVPITKQGMENLKAELKNLLTVERPRIKRAIAEAREHGDLRENAEFHAAKEKQSFIEGRINSINGKMASLFVVEPAPAAPEDIRFGAKVTIENVDTEEIFSYQIVGPDEAEIVGTTEEFDLEARAERYSFQPLRLEQPPDVQDASWPRTPIDRFLLARLDEAGLAPAPAVT